MKRRHRGVTIWLPRFLSRLNLYLFSMSLIVFLLYLVGNFQRFAGETQLLLLQVMDVYFYLFFVLALGNTVVYSVLSTDRAGKKTIFYLKTFLRALLIALLYLVMHLLSAFFKGI
ncbi:MAG: hypothetical protein PQJ50_07210 [Spirochaetales bacterium]|nr:hypothetical protein [Spirochaetales bacterium]